MAHREQIEFCQMIRRSYPGFFIHRKVLDIGSLDINGNNRFLFRHCQYTGIDIGIGENVDVVCPVHLYEPGYLFGFIICTETLEHDRHYRLSLKKMFDLLSPEGGLLITCATTGRPQHGTIDCKPEDSPFTTDYYQNISESVFRELFPVGGFSLYKLVINSDDLYFFGIKK